MSEIDAFVLLVLAVAFLPIPGLFVCWARGQSDVDPVKEAVPSQITGAFDRLFAFTLAFVLTDPSAIATILTAWVLAKLASNWQRRPMNDDQEHDRQIRANTLISLMGNTLSVSFGLAAGLLARCVLN